MSVDAGKTVTAALNESAIDKKIEDLKSDINAQTEGLKNKINQVVDDFETEANGIRENLKNTAKKHGLPYSR